MLISSTIASKIPLSLLADLHNMNKYFQAFQKEISWFNRKKEPIQIVDIEEYHLPKKFKDIFPTSTELIAKSQKTSIEFKGKAMMLFSWEIGEKICGWLCQFDQADIQLIPEHQILVEYMGGIIESFNGPESIEIEAINYNYALSLNQEFMFVASMSSEKLNWEEYYLDVCENVGLTPIDLSNSVFFSREENGAQYFYNKISKEVFLFSHDHSFDFVEFLPDQAEYTLHKIKGVHTFTEFVELNARQWKKFIDSKSC